MISIPLLSIHTTLEGVYVMLASIAVTVTAGTLLMIRGHRKSKEND